MQPEPMRALTLWQPWAWTKAIGIKRIENRTWRPPGFMLGQRFALHAGKRWDRASHEALLNNAWTPPPRAELAAGAVVATCRLVTVATSADEAARLAGADQARWFFGPFGWVVADVVTLPRPIPCRGFQGLWRLPADVAVAVKGADDAA
jgi:hypothetical protein